MAVKAPRAWPQIIEIPPSQPDRRNADPAATSKISAFDLDQVLARTTHRNAAPTESNEGDERATAIPPPLAEPERITFADPIPDPLVKAAPASEVQRVSVPALELEPPAPGSLDAAWDDLPSEPPPAQRPTPLVPDAMEGQLVNLASEPPDANEAETKVGEVQSQRLAKLMGSEPPDANEAVTKVGAIPTELLAIDEARTASEPMLPIASPALVASPAPSVREPVAAKPLAPAPRRGRSARFVILAGVLLAAAAVVVVLLRVLRHH